MGLEIDMKKGIQPSGALTRKKILRASVKVFLEKGYAGATAKEIAELAGVSSGSPFGMFGNKEGVLLELLHHMFGGQFAMTAHLIGEDADPLLTYAVETALQLNITELSEPLRELYVMSYTLPTNANYIYEQMTARLPHIFGKYLPDLSTKDFYELEIASAGITRSFMAKPCDLYFTIERKVRRYLSSCFKVYEVPREVFLPIIDRVLEMDLHTVAEQVIAQAVKSAEEGFEKVMTESK